MSATVECEKKSFEQLENLIKSSTGVVVMAHKNSDFDAVGAMYGIYSLVKIFQKPCFIVADVTKTLASASVDRIINSEGGDVVIPAQQAMLHVDKDWLVILTDTNRPSLVESDRVWRTAGKKVVIDHHIKYDHALEGIDLFIHETAISSSCEMVCMALFHCNAVFSKSMCHLLMAGIMLDTHRFSQRTSAQTFEIASYLCAHGAFVPDVYNMFSCNHSDYIKRAQIICNATIRDRYALSVVKKPGSNIRIIAPQAADELLTLRGVKASFVVYKAGGVLNISARGDADYDVAEVMEKMGGGGSRSMAGAQLPVIDAKKTIRLLRQAIKEYVQAHPEIANI